LVSFVELAIATDDRLGTRSHPASAFCYDAVLRLPIKRPIARCLPNVISTTVLVAASQTELANSRSGCIEKIDFKIVLPLITNGPKLGPVLIMDMRSRSARLQQRDSGSGAPPVS
jgi:hypothetical protein